MKQKKTPQANLERSRSVFALIGLIVTLGVVIFAFEWKTYERELIDLGSLGLEIDEEIVPVTVRQKPLPPPPPPPICVFKVAKENIDVRDNIDIPDHQDFGPEEVIEFIEIKREEEPVDTVPFILVEKKPIFPGCENLKDVDQRDICFEQKLAEHIHSVFKYPPIAKDIGIQGKVFVSFVIDQEGNIIKATVARNVDRHLDAEALRIVGTFPKMTPGKQRGKPVPVAFTVPINFKLQ